MITDNEGYDAKKRADGKDMFKAGIIDPVKVTREALVNTASAAAIFLTTDAAIADEPERKGSATNGGGMDGCDVDSNKEKGAAGLARPRLFKIAVQ